MMKILLGLVPTLFVCSCSMLLSGMHPATNVDQPETYLLGWQKSLPQKFTGLITRADQPNIYGDTSVAISKNGSTSMVAWVQSGDLFVSVKRDGVWARPTGLADKMASRATTPSVKISADGSKAFMAWAGYYNDQTVVYLATWRNGVWELPNGPSDFMSPAGLLGVVRPRLAMSDSGDKAVLVWTSAGFTVDQRIYKCEYIASAWACPTSVNEYMTPNPLAAQDAEVGMSADGSLVVIAWAHYISTNVVKVMRSVRKDGVWTHPAVSGDAFGVPTISQAFKIAMSDNGSKAIIVWHDIDMVGAFDRIFASTFDGVSWTDPTSAAQRISLNQYDVNPSVAYSADGTKAIVAWRNVLGSQQIQVSTFAGGVWTKPANNGEYISLAAGTYASAPQISINEDGSQASVFFAQQDSGQQRLYRSEFSAGTWQKPASLAAYSSADTPDAIPFAPFYAATSDGAAGLVVWMQGSVSAADLYVLEKVEQAWNPRPAANDFISLRTRVARDAKIFVSESGTTAAVLFSLYQSGLKRLYMSTYYNGTWHHPLDTNSYISFAVGEVNTEQAELVFSGDGDTGVLVWTQTGHSSGAVETYRGMFKDGEWTLPATIENAITPYGGSGSKPLHALKISHDGTRAVLAWYLQRAYVPGPPYHYLADIYLSTYQNGIWTDPTVLSTGALVTDVNAYSLPPAIDLTEDGRRWSLAYASQGATRIQVISSVDGVLSRPVDVNDYISPLGAGANVFDLTLSAAGTSGHALWSQQNTDGNDVLFTAKFDGSTWSKNNDINAYISVNDPYLKSPTLNFSRASDEGFIAWTQYDEMDKQQVYKADYVGGVFIKPVDLADNISKVPGGITYLSHRAAISPTGGQRIISWQRYDEMMVLSATNHEWAAEATALPFRASGAQYYGLTFAKFIPGAGSESEYRPLFVFPDLVENPAGLGWALQYFGRMPK